MTLTTERIVLNEARNVSLVAMVQAVGGEFGKIENRPAILILPGGGYAMCSDREAEVVAYPYLQAGYHAFVLRYSVAEHKTWPNPLNDYEQAMELIRGKAEKWHILTDKIAVIGFSAGGHLAACAATASKNRPNAAILGYAALGKQLTDAMHREPPAIVPTECVDENTCPCFIFTARDDKIIPVITITEFEQALSKYSIMYESHVYAYGNHGFSTGEANVGIGKQCGRVSHWVRDSIEWLGEVFGVLTSSGMTEPTCPAKLYGDWEPTLSVTCSIGHLRQQSAAVDVLANVFAAVAKLHPSSSDSFVNDVAVNFQLREVMFMLGQSEEVIAQIDAALRMIPNIK